MAVSMREVLDMPWVGVRVPLVLSFFCGFCSIYEIVRVACQSHRDPKTLTTRERLRKC